MANASELFTADPCPTSGTLSTRSYINVVVDRSEGTLTNVISPSSASLASPSAASFGAELYVTNSLGFELWLGMASTQGVEETPGWSEDHDRENSTSDDHPTPLQGANFVEINPFPTPVEPEPAALPQRDATRYHKAYSFTRRQPVRVRIFRDR